MFIGILIGLILVCFAILIGIPSTVPTAKIRVVKIVVTLCIGLIMFVSSVCVGHYIEVESSHKYIASYSIKKETIETSINSDNLSDIEKIELVKMATELNGELAGKQYKCGKWYSFGLLPKELKELEPIDITGGSK